MTTNRTEPCAELDDSFRSGSTGTGSVIQVLSNAEVAAMLHARHRTLQAQDKQPSPVFSQMLEYSQKFTGTNNPTDSIATIDKIRTYAMRSSGCFCCVGSVVVVVVTVVQSL